MKQHKWHKEIKAWADGAEIQFKYEDEYEWVDEDIPDWSDVELEFRIKPQPKEPQYLYVYIGENNGYIFSMFHPSKYDNPECIGKIKLEVEE